MQVWGVLSVLAMGLLFPILPLSQAALLPTMPFARARPRLTSINKIGTDFSCICWLLCRAFNRWSPKREAHIKKHMPEYRGKQVARESIKQCQGDPNKTHSQHPSPALIQMS